MNRFALALLVLLGSFLGWAGDAKANSCWNGAVADVQFGSVGPQGATAVGSFVATCQKTWTANATPTYFRLCLTIPTSSPLSGINPRRMSNHQGGELHYDLFSNPTHTNVIGNALSGTIYTSTFTLSQAGSPQSTVTFPVYGRIVPGQARAAGAYQSQNYATIHWVASTTGMPPVSACVGGNTLQNVYQGASATWEDRCAILGANDLSFGARDNLATSVSSQTTLSITCPSGTPWQVGLNNGQNFSGTTRRMRHATTNAWISYGLFQNTARTTAWGNTLGNNTLGGTGTGTTQTLTIYGQAPAQAVSASGSYQDTVTVTLTY